MPMHAQIAKLLSINSAFYAAGQHNLQSVVETVDSIDKSDGGCAYVVCDAAHRYIKYSQDALKEGEKQALDAIELVSHTPAVAFQTQSIAARRGVVAARGPQSTHHAT